jgi:hypothetical protein
MKNKKQKNKTTDEDHDQELSIPDFDDSLKLLNGAEEEQPEVYKISKRGKQMTRNDFLKSASVLGGLAALGSLLDGCTESDYDITGNGDECTCHAVCTCNKEIVDGDQHQKGNSYKSVFDQNKQCTCDTVCTCNTVCTCDAVTVCSCDDDSDCSCDSNSGGGYYYTYWYPN